MELSTREVFPSVRSRAYVSGENVSLVAEHCPTLINLFGNREERLTLLKSWAHAEGCELIVGPPVLERNVIPAGWYDGTSGSRTGD